MFTDENISAISTAPMTAGVAVIRISGPDPLKIAKKMFACKTPTEEFEPYKMYVGNILAGPITDFGMCVYFKAPRSYTGEDMIEFHCHGGIAITRAILKKTFELGCRPATRGEFTKRAFMNGKLSLSSAEGLIDMINAESDQNAKAGYYLYREKLFNEIKKQQNDLKYVLALIDANVDYPEEDIENAEIEDVRTRLKGVSDSIKSLMSRYDGSVKIKNGVKVVICGKPNAGKSSILNSVLGQDKAIVTDVAGTTRDIVEGERDIDGVRFCFYDTAGIRESEDKVESIGIDRSRKAIDNADVIVFIADAVSGFTEEDEKIYSAIKDRKPITVLNKTDVTKECRLPYRSDISVSAKTGEGVRELIDEIYARSQVSAVVADEEYLTEERHYLALKDALYSIEKTLSALEKDPLDILAINVDAAWKALGLITGETVSEAVIDEIFSKFCVGK